MRFRKRDLDSLDKLAQSLGVPSRSRLANLALQKFLDSFAEELPAQEQKRRVKIFLDLPINERLDKAAKRLRRPKAELARMALKEFAEQNVPTFIRENRER